MKNTTHCHSGASDVIIRKTGIQAWILDLLLSTTVLKDDNSEDNRKKIF
ncbi:MAG: hypothetical protein PHU42_00360 [Patescibacteria group bacterium]|nr:hypothetical protein [Patescibacteria group bacterium]